MKNFLLLPPIHALFLTLLVACQPSSEDSKTIKYDLAGIWESTFEIKGSSNQIIKNRILLTLSEDSYQYSWYKKLVAEDDSSVIYDWIEVSRENGRSSMTEGYMQWTADIYGHRRYNKNSGTWTQLRMHPSSNDHAIFSSLEGNKLTLKEDYNMDGDYNGFFDKPETLIFLKKE
ncbi:hypothetical protein [Candidatus Nitrosacidococcus tergens]|uniref:Uncharacterized protein n=1 Tax=Candidatus Nitrosacidococcus tergens TaxID=553981 RepID=A0A7G1QAM1_9GAMM|nr:hypothetical protein [Candidatus Nitrosacidococcus tergens]CAB1276645.1 conserved protein of unknown function [Candidatus Nitrosacidococcus tergens]